MCSRYTFGPDLFDRLQGLIDFVSPDLRVHMDAPLVVTPALEAPVISAARGELLLSKKFWGFPSRFPGPKARFLVNARAETVLEKKSFQEGIRHHRAAVPASQFFEQSRDGLYSFREEEGKPLFLAGFYEKKIVTFRRGTAMPCGFLPDPDDQRPLAEQKSDSGISERELSCFTILTTAAREPVAEVHDRMPVLLSAEEIRPWIRGENVREILSRVSSEVLVRSET